MAGGPATLDAAPGGAFLRADIFLLNPDHSNHTATGLAGVNDVTLCMYLLHTRGIACRVWL